MKVFRGLPNAASRAPCALTIGNFDGVHRGHQALLAQVRAAASRLQLDAAVMTFEPHPREFFAMLSANKNANAGAGIKPAAMKAPKRIANLRDKLESLAEAGIDRVVVEHFNAGFAALSPQDFIEKVLVQGLHVKWLMVGEDFCFGSRRAGTIETLLEAGKRYGFDVVTMPTVMNAGLRISSSSVRSALAVGDFVHTRELLGHPYAISGHVVHGEKLGRSLGFPTLNMRLRHQHPALNGIFVVQVHGLAAQPLPGVASLGVRPTVDDSGRILLETHVFDYNQNCYGKLVRVEFLHKLRNEEKYIDLPTLTAAIARDADNARRFFRDQGSSAVAATDRI